MQGRIFRTAVQSHRAKNGVFKLYYRPLIRMRVSRPRREYGLDGFSFIERDAGEQGLEIKVTKTGYFTKKKVLEIGLQAANQIKVNK